ncbi:MAG: DUF4304 domain-containing protein [Pseudorhodobacter sp.]|nr:DUF4304 domain-containing protein [Pseudorhodobacter sp.]
MGAVTPAEVVEDYPADVVDQGKPDNAVRAHLAANDPGFPEKREQAVQAILAAIDAVAQAHGFTAKPKSWARQGPLGTVSLHLQRGRYGFDCTINLGFQPENGEAAGPWQTDDLIPLGRFHQGEMPRGQDEIGTIFYLDVLENPAALSLPIQVLDRRALPWLLAHLTDRNAPLRPI